MVRQVHAHQSITVNCSTWYDYYVKMNQTITRMNNETINPNDLEVMDLQKLYINIYTVAVPLIVLIGLFGNIASIAVFTSSYLKRHSSSVFLAALAFVDNLFLITLFLTWLDQTASNILTTAFACQIAIYVTYISGFLSVWLVVGFTTERYIAICHPLRAPMLCSTRRQKIAVAGLSIFALIFYNFAVWTTKVTQYGRRMTCAQVDNYHQIVRVITWVDTIITMVVPFTCIVFMNLRVIWKAAIFHNKRKNCYKPTDSGKLKRNKHLTNKSQMRVTRTLLIVSTLFLVFNFPSHLSRLYNIIVVPTSMEKYEYFLHSMCQLLYYCTFSINFIVYALYGKHFQKSFWLMIRSFKQTFGCHTERHYRKDKYSVSQKTTTVRWSSDLQISRC